VRVSSNPLNPVRSSLSVPPLFFALPVDFSLARVNLEFAALFDALWEKVYDILPTLYQLEWCLLEETVSFAKRLPMKELSVTSSARILKRESGIR